MHIATRAFLYNFSKRQNIEKITPDFLYIRRKLHEIRENKHVTHKKAGKTRRFSLKKWF